MNEISRNHNETVFLYDMLNEKAKEVKGTVKSVDVVKKNIMQIEKFQDKPIASQAEKLNDIVMAERPEEIEKRKQEVMSDNGLQKNDKVLKLYKLGLDSKQIARELSIGIGEVRLVVDLYKKQQ